MRYIKNSVGALTFMGLLLINTGCDKVKDFGDMNTNPAITASVSTAGLLTNVLATISTWATSTRSGLYAQYFSETQYTENSLYALPQLDFAANYSGSLYDLQNIINLNTSEPERVAQFGSSSNQIAVARILKAFIYWHITDAWGDIPYSEALQGKTPAYDKQEDVYADLLKELKEAGDQFDGGASFKGDILYDGNIAKWKKFANSLRILVAMRMSNVNQAGAATVVTEAISDPDGYISSNADNAVIDYPGGTFNNIWWELYDGRQDFAVSETLMDFLTSNSDSRISAFGTSNLGFPYGLKRDDAVTFYNDNPGWSRILNTANRQQGSPIALVTSSQVKLALAEARERGMISTGTTAEYYKDAIKDSWEQWGVFSQAAYDAYLTKSGVSLAANPLEKIATQRWLATYPNGLQGWFEWRRTGFPVLTPTPNAVNSSGEIPVRYTYGNAERSLNEVNRKIAEDRMGGDTQDTKVWWDK
jgi:hypothetical protein